MMSHTYRLLLIACCCAFCATQAVAQRDVRRADSLQQVADLLERPADTVVYGIVADTLTATQVQKAMRKQFVPDPKRALWLAIVCPGAGQIYNRKYWKLPIFYGGFVGCTYALIWNQQMYLDYSQAYLDLMDDDPTTQSYMNMLPPNYNIAGNEARFQTIFKNRKDRFRRYRDLSAFAFVAVYALSVIDAYVDAHLSVFDITPDLSLSVSPTVISQKEVVRTSSSYGLGVGLNF